MGSERAQRFHFKCYPNCCLVNKFCRNMWSVEAYASYIMLRDLIRIYSEVFAKVVILFIISGISQFRKCHVNFLYFKVAKYRL